MTNLSKIFYGGNKSFMRIKELREEKNLSQWEVAKGINSSQRNIGRWENEEVQPLAEYVVKLADFFGVSTDYLLGRSDDFGNVTVNGSAPELSDEEREILALFRKMTHSQKVRFVGYGEGLVGVSMGKNA